MRSSHASTSFLPRGVLSSTVPSKLIRVKLLFHNGLANELVWRSHWFFKGLSSILLRAFVPGCSSNVLRGSAPLAVDDALGLPPFLPDVEVIPNFAVAALEEIEAIRIRMDDQLHGELAQYAAAVSSNKSEHYSLSLKQRRAGAILDGQVEKQMAVDDVGVGFALAAPHACQPTSYSPPKKPFVKSLTGAYWRCKLFLREQLAGT